MKRVVIFVLFILSYFLSAASAPTYAQGTWKYISPKDWSDAMQTDRNNNPTFVAGSFANTCYTVASMAVGEPMAYNSSGQNISAVSFLKNLSLLTFTTPPADFGLWLADTGQTLGFIPKQAYAQGVGFSGMLPLLPIWKVFRNVAYLLMAIVMVVIGFMIMFRKKIDPKTVVTAQSAIPRVIIALILITFSYAIVGLVIDLMYVVIAILVSLFQAAGLTSAQTTTTTGHMGSTLWTAFTNFSPLKLLFGVTTDPMEILATEVVAGATLTALAATVPGLGIIVGAAAVILPLIYLIYGVALIFLWVKLFAFFVSSYIQIILALVIAPLQLLTEAVPGSTAFSSWFKNLISNIAVFPVAAAMFMLSAMFQQFSTIPDQGTIWRPPYVTFSPEVVAVASLVSIGLLFAIQPVCSSIKEALKAKPVAPMFDMGGAGGSAMQWLSAAYYIKSINPGDIIGRITGKKHGAAPE